jgi:hypothetical protein
VKEKYAWLELHYHGTDHKDRNEWFNKKFFDLPYEKYFFRGFKAPWWRMDQQTANLFSISGYTLSVKKNYFNVKGRSVYIFDEGRCIIPDVAYENKNFIGVHSHVQEQKNKDGLPDMFDKIINLLDNDRFLFISEALCYNH